MKKIVAILLVLTLLCCGCGKDSKNFVQEPTQIQETTEPTIAPGYEVLGGTWKAHGLYYNDRLIELSSNEALAQLYDTDMLIFSEDGSFLYYSLFFYEGTYAPKSEGVYTLNVERCYRLELVDDQMQEVEATLESPRTYLLTAAEDGMFRLAKMDLMTGLEMADDMPLLMKKQP